MKERYCGKAALVAAFLISTGFHSATINASMNVSPVRVFLSQDNDTDVVRITNNETSAKSYEIEIVAWTQSNEKREVYSPTEDILAVPPLFTLNPGEEQILRVGLLTNVDPDIEKTYRIFVTELASPDGNDTQTAGINMRLQVGLPVFVAPLAMPTASLAYVEAKVIGDQNFIRFRNSGNTHVKTMEVRYSGPGNDEDVVTPAVGYIHAGKSGFLPVSLPNGDQAGTVTVVTERLGALEYELPLAP